MELGSPRAEPRDSPMEEISHSIRLPLGCPGFQLEAQVAALPFSSMKWDEGVLSHLRQVWGWGCFVRLSH